MEKSKTVSQSATGTLIVYLSMATQNYFSQIHIIRFTNLILSVPQKHILILILRSMITIWKFLVTRWFTLHPFNTKCGGAYLYYNNISLWEL